MIVTIIGVGEVGSTTACCLLASKANITLNLVDVANIQGRILDLEHAAIYNNNTLRYNNEALTNRSDIIIYTAGFSNAVGQDRNAVAAANKTLVNELFTKIDCKKDAIIIAVTNPVELVAQWISEVYAHEICVVGTGTALDTYRLKYLLARNYELPATEIETMVIGEHGEHMTPLYSLTKIGSTKLDVKQEELDKLTKELRLSARTIRETEPATKYGVTQCVLKLMDWIANQSDEVIPVSTPLDSYYADLAGIDQNLFVSVPCIWKNKPVGVKMALNEQEAAHFKNACLSIHKHV